MSQQKLMKIGEKTDGECILTMGKKMENINEQIRLALGINVLAKMVSARVKEPGEIDESLLKNRCSM